MKKIFFIFMAILTCLIFSVLQANAQITIGSGATANTGSLLDLKETNAIGVNSTHGLALPRVELREIDYLYPMLDNMPAYQPASPTKATQDKIHTGLLVYNLTTDLDKRLCRGVYSWTGIDWRRLGKPCILPMCEYEIESNTTANLFYQFYCQDIVATQSDALQHCKQSQITNTDGTNTYSYHLMTYKEFVETWNQDPVNFPNDSKYFVDYHGFVTLGIIRADGTMEVLNDVAPFPAGMPIGGTLQGSYTVRCARDK